MIKIANFFFSLATLSIAPCFVHAEVTCKSVPGEYIVKYKQSNKRSAAAFENQKTTIRRALGAEKKSSFSSISPNLEVLKISDSFSAAGMDAAAASYSGEIEYIQPNCIYELDDFTVKGSLRDPAKNTAVFPKSIAVGAYEDAAVDIIGQNKSVNSISLIEKSENSSDEEVIAKLRPEFLQIFDRPRDSDGLSEILAYGSLKITVGGSSIPASDGFVWLKNRGDGNFRAERLRDHDEEYYGITDIASGYIDDNLERDLAISYDYLFGAGKLRILLNVGGENASEKTLSLSSDALHVEINDVDNDGNSDVIVWIQESGSSIDGVEYYLGTGTGDFKPRKTLAMNGFFGEDGFAVSDINNDGLPDLIMVDYADFSVIMNSGNNQFAARYEVEYGYSFEDHQFAADRLLMADMDGNGYHDMVLLGSYANLELFSPEYGAVAVLYNFGTGFTEIEKFTYGDYDGNDNFQVSDINGDSRPDVIVSRSSFDVVKVMKNKAAGTPGDIINLELDATYDVLLDSQPFAAALIDPFGIDSAIVSLSKGNQIYRTLTDEHGNFEFRGLPAGVYTASAFVEGYSFPTFDNKLLNLNNNVASLNHFGKRQPHTPPASPATIPSHMPNDFGINHQWGLFNYGQVGGTVNIDVDALEAWSITKGDGVYVGVLDTGLDVQHPDIRANALINPGEIENNGIDDDKNGFIDDTYGFNAVTGKGGPLDEEQHGTHVAGIIASIGGNTDGISGVSPGAKVIALATEVDGGVSTSAVLAGVDYLIKAKQAGKNVRVANASYGSNTECQPAAKDYIQALANNNILFVTSAGNDSLDNDKSPKSPANCDFPNVLAVAAVDRAGNLATFSNFGASNVDVAAPGVGILSLQPYDGYREDDGTSMAAPFVSGVAALIAAANPSLSAVQIKDRILSSAKPIAALNGKMRSPGIVSAFNAVNNINTGIIPSLPQGTPTVQPGGPGDPSANNLLTYTASAIKPGKKSSLNITFSEELNKEALKCFSGKASPKPKGSKILLKLKKNKLSAALVDSKGKAINWPANGKFTLSVKPTCAKSASGKSAQMQTVNAKGSSLELIYGKKKK